MEASGRSLPSTLPSTPRQSTARSARIFRSWAAAAARPASSSPGVRHLATPTLLPRLAGFTKQGSPTAARTRWMAPAGAASQSPRRTTTEGTPGGPAAREGDVQELEKALHRAVFPVGTMENGEGHVQPLQPPGGSAQSQRVARVIRRRRRAAAEQI